MKIRIKTILVRHHVTLKRIHIIITTRRAILQSFVGIFRKLLLVFAIFAPMTEVYTKKLVLD